MQDEPAHERRIDQFFSGPGARADEWRELVDAAKTWSVGSGDRNRFLAQLAEFKVTEEFHAYPGRVRVFCHAACTIDSKPALNPEGKIP